jgi:hypothetical protein
LLVQEVRLRFSRLELAYPLSLPDPPAPQYVKVRTCQSFERPNANPFVAFAGEYLNWGIYAVEHTVPGFLGSLALRITCPETGHAPNHWHPHNPEQQPGRRSKARTYNSFGRTETHNERGRLTLHYIIAVQTHDPDGNPYEGRPEDRAREAFNLTLGRGVDDPVNLTKIKKEDLLKEKLEQLLLRSWRPASSNAPSLQSWKAFSVSLSLSGKKKATAPHPSERGPAFRPHTGVLRSIFSIVGRPAE